MKLYYAPGACSLAPHIVLNELGMKYDAVKVDLKTKKTAAGEDFYKINPKGYVPAILLDNGELLTEDAVILQFLADQKPEMKLIPKAGTWERYRVMEMLNFVATEIHKGFGPLFHLDMVKEKDAQAQLKTYATENLGKRFTYLTEQLKGKKFLMGEQYTVADAYLFTLLGWTKWTGVDLTKWPALMGFAERVQTRPAVAKTLEFEKTHKG